MIEVAERYWNMGLVKAMLDSELPVVVETFNQTGKRYPKELTQGFFGHDKEKQLSDKANCTETWSSRVGQVKRRRMGECQGRAQGLATAFGVRNCSPMRRSIEICSLLKLFET